MSTGTETALPRKPLVIRQACNRCHASKLRCPRTAGSGTKPCQRCLKAGAECVYDPPQRLGRPRQKHRSRTDSTPTPPVRAASSEVSSPRRRPPSPARTGYWNGEDLGTAREGSDRGGSEAAQGDRTASLPDLDFSTTPHLRPAAAAGAVSRPDKHTTFHGDLEFLDAFNPDGMHLDVVDPCGLSHGQPGGVEEQSLYSELMAFDFTVASPAALDPTAAGHPPSTPQTTDEYLKPSEPPRQQPRSATHPTPDGPFDASSLFSSSPEDCILEIVQLQAELNKHSKELAILTRKGQEFTSPGAGSRATPIADDCFKGQLKANLRASEKMLELLRRIHHQSMLSPSVDPALEAYSYLSTPESMTGPDTGHPSNPHGYGHPRRDSTFTSDTSSALDGDPFGAPADAGLAAGDPQQSILAFFMLTSYLRLLHNFDVLISVFLDRITEPIPPTPDSQPSGHGGAYSPFEEQGGHHHHHHHASLLPDISLDTFSFDTTASRSLQAVLHVQLINAVLAKIKVAIQRLLSPSEPFGDHNRTVEPQQQQQQHSSFNCFTPSPYYHHTHTHNHDFYRPHPHPHQSSPWTPQHHHHHTPCPHCPSSTNSANNNSTNRPHALPTPPEHPSAPAPQNGSTHPSSPPFTDFFTSSCGTPATGSAFAFSSSASASASSSSLAPGMLRALQRALAETDRLEASLRGRAEAVRRWSLEGF